MKTEFHSVFIKLRDILRRHSGTLTVGSDTSDHFSLVANVGPAVLRAWNGKMKKPKIPVAWVQIGKAYVRYHLLALYENAELHKGLSKELKAHMQGKTCFNFKSSNKALFQELELLTAKGNTMFKKAGYISE
jgi:hypothetical protein